MVRFILLILIVAVGCWGWQNFTPESFRKDNIEATMQKEKTINAVQQGRENRRLEAEKVMEQF